MAKDQNARGKEPLPAPKELVPLEGPLLPDRETIAFDGPITGPGIPFQPEPVDR